ncbi:MAG TPA: winged helix-turn-helix domain-containing protein [Steroidobacteraceae bacterium]|nr:winged helix-turn-helix domain-containing protein [Steroidobacteraceae bacterium]
MAPQAGTTNIRDLTPDPAGYQVDDLIIDLAPRRVRRAGTVIRLQALSFDLLVALVRAAPNLLSFDQLSERVWPGLVVTPETIVQRVKLLRGALGDDPHAPRYIEGVRGRGYRMVAEVRPLTESHGTPETIVPPSLIETKGEASPNVHAGIAATGAAAVSGPSATPPAPPRPAKWVPLGWIGGALIVLAALAGSWAISHYRGSSKPAERTSVVVFPVIHSLVVLPLENLSGDKEQEYFADGMTDALTTDLAQIGSLRIISRTSAMHFKGSKETLPQIGHDLQVDAVVEGTVARAEGRVRVTAQLIQASSDQHLWARTYERDLKDVLALQDEIAQDITEQIRVKLTPKERSLLIQVHPVDPEAYDAYLRGRYWWGKGGAEAWKGLDYFQKAIAKDPSYALAYAGVADSYLILGDGFLSPKEAFPKAKEAAIKALEFDPSLAEAHASMASMKFYNDWDWSGAVNEIRQAIALNPNNASAHRRYADLLTAVGRFDEALKEMERGRDLDPFSIASNFGPGGILDSARRYDDALRQYRRGLEMFPDCFDCYNAIADIYEHQRMFAEAFAARQQALSMQKDPTVGALAEAYKRGGYRGWLLKKIEILEHAPPQTIQLQKKESHLDMNKAFGIAYFYTLLNDEAHAMPYLERAYDGRNPAVLFLQVSPLWDPIRSSPRFRDLVRRIGVPQPNDDKN